MPNQPLDWEDTPHASESSDKSIQETRDQRHPLKRYIVLGAGGLRFVLSQHNNLVTPQTQGSTENDNLNQTEQDTREL